MTQDPGAPRTDELARNAARNTLRDKLSCAMDDASFAYEDGAVTYMSDAVVREHAVTWERDVNSAGVAVRRYVLRGAWEADPEAVTR